jgi:hypothetical protein
MRQRGISEQDIEYCLQNYLISYKDKAGNPIYRANLPSGKHIKVVIAADITDTTVITVAD